MALSKTFETLFRLNAKWIGGPGVAKAQAALHKTAGIAQRANVRIQGMAGAVFRGVASYDLLRRSAGAAINVLQRSIAAASDAQEAHDNLSLSMERNTKFYSGLAGKTVPEVNRIIAENVEMLIKQSEQMEKTGHDAETLQAGWDKMIGARALTPKQVQEQSKGFSDVLSYMYGANATQEESVELGEMISDLIIQGNLALAKRMDLSQGHILQLRKINLQVKKGEISAEEGIKRRQRFFVEATRSMAGETERVFAKPSGKIAQMHIQIQNLLENMGKPFVERAGTIADSFKEISVALGPVSQELAKIVDEQLGNLAKWLGDHKTDLPGWLNTITERLKGVWDMLMLINNVPVLFDLPKFIKDYHLALPGSAGTTVPTIPKAMDWRYGGGTNQEAMEKAAQAVDVSGAPTPFEKKIIQPPPGGVTALQEARARIAAEMQKPGMEQLLMASTQAEVGDQPAAVHQAYMESVTNRALAEGKTLEQILRNPNYYPGTTKAKLGRTFTGEKADRMRAQIAAVMGGSNIANFATGNESGSVRSGGAPILYNPKTGERFVGENWTKAWIEQMKAKSLKGATSGLTTPAGGAGTQNISMNSPVTVNGVAPGREQMVARQVRTAVRDPIRQLLDQIKAARNYESRLGYV